MRPIKIEQFLDAYFNMQFEIESLIQDESIVSAIELELFQNLYFEF